MHVGSGVQHGKSNSVGGCWPTMLCPIARGFIYVLHLGGTLNKDMNILSCKKKLVLIFKTKALIRNQCLPFVNDR